MKYTIILSFLLIAAWLVNSNAQTPSILWQRSLGGTEEEAGFDIFQNQNGKYVVIGFAESSNGNVSNHHSPTFVQEDVWICVLDSMGNLLANNCYGGSLDERAYSIKPTIDNGYIFCGHTNSNDGDINGALHASLDCWIVKLDSNFAIQWHQCVGGSDFERSFDVIQSNDGGYLITGYTATPNDGDIINYHGGGADVLVIKLSSNGIREWVRVFGGTRWDEGRSCLQVTDGGYLILGSTDSDDGDVTGTHTSQDIWMLRLDSLGQLIWQNSYGGSSVDFPNKILQSTDGCLFISATTGSNDGDVSQPFGPNDFWLIKLDSAGNVLWEKCFGGYFWESSLSASLTPDGGIIMSGYASGDSGMVAGFRGGFEDAWMVKIDSSGNFVWGKCLGGSMTDRANAAVQTHDQGFIMTGMTNSTDGDVSGSHGKNDLWIVRLSALGLSVFETQDFFQDFTAYQNDIELILRFFAKSKGNARLILYDQIGRMISEINVSFQEGINYNVIPIINLAPGAYILSLQSKLGSLIDKVVIR